MMPVSSSVSAVECLAPAVDVLALPTTVVAVRGR